MYHMWLGSNGLPVSPRKQRALLFQFCTTNFVTEEEMRYCYARLLSNGDPSGPVKYVFSFYFLIAFSTRRQLVFWFCNTNFVSRKDIPFLPPSLSFSLPPPPLLLLYLPSSFTL